MNTKVTVDDSARQFVISTGNSSSSIPFEVVFHQAAELERRIQSTVLDNTSSISSQISEKEIGMLKQFEQHRALLDQYAHLGDKRTWFDNRTPVPVQQVLELRRRLGGKVRIYTGDAVTGRDWLEEFDTIGSIDRTPGPMCMPTLQTSETACGTILTDCVVRVQCVESGLDLYLHPTYHVPEMKLVEATDKEMLDRGLAYDVHVRDVDGHLASFKCLESLADAAHWIAFMHGRVHNLHEAEI